MLLYCIDRPTHYVREKSSKTIYRLTRVIAQFMKSAHLVDFYQGWLIEVMSIEGGFKSICRSPDRDEFGMPLVYPSDFAAMSAAKQKISQINTYHGVARVLRELYESNHLKFEEWQMLRQSLTQMVRATS